MKGLLAFGFTKAPGQGPPPPPPPLPSLPPPPPVVPPRDDSQPASTADKRPVGRPGSGKILSWREWKNREPKGRPITAERYSAYVQRQCGVNNRARKALLEKRVASSNSSSSCHQGDEQEAGDDQTTMDEDADDHVIVIINDENLPPPPPPPPSNPESDHPAPQATLPPLNPRNPSASWRHLFNFGSGWKGNDDDEEEEETVIDMTTQAKAVIDKSSARYKTGDNSSSSTSSRKGLPLRQYSKEELSAAVKEYNSKKVAGLEPSCAAIVKGTRIPERTLRRHIEKGWTSGK